MIGVWVLDYPPNRFIGSEMMTHKLMKAVQASGRMVKVATVEGGEPHTFDGVEVSQNLDGLSVVVTHMGMPLTGWCQRGAKRVAICHNAEAETLLAVHTQQFDLVVCNSEHMRGVLEQRDPHNYMVVHPPAPAPGELSHGDRVTIVNLNENKVGLFWELAKSMPEQGFLAVLGGYADQVIPAVVPPNVELLEHVPADRMRELVWSRTRLLLAPSLRESWNMTAGEALAHGITTVATDLPGVRENLGDTATYVPRDDLPAWVQAVTTAPLPNVHAQQRAQFNHDRYGSEVADFVEAVNGLGEHHNQAA